MVLKPSSDIAIAAGEWLGVYEYRIFTSQNIDLANGDSSRFYEAWNTNNAHFAGGGDAQFGFEIKYVLDSGVVKNRLIVNSGNNDYPQYYSVNDSNPTYLDEFWIESGDVVRAFATIDPSSLHAEFTCFPEMLYRASTVNTNDFLSPSLTYNFATNRLSWILPASYTSTSDPFITAHRTDYLLDNDLWLPNTVGYTTYIIHTQGTPSTGNSSNDIIPGTWRIRRKISAPSGMTSILASITFTQIEIDAYNAAAAAQALLDAAAAQALLDAAAAQLLLDAAAAQLLLDAAAAAAAAQAALDAANNNTPPNTPRGRRGNHNFW